MARRLLSFLVFTLITGTTLSSAQSNSLSVVYPRASDGVRWNYHVGLLELALDRSGVAFDLSPTPQEMTQPREMVNLRNGKVSVIWAGTSQAFEQEFLPVRVPLYRGLLGYRVCLIDANSQPAFSAVESTAQLTEFRMGQGVGWADVDILRANSFTVFTARYDLLFGMTTANRFDCYLRGVTEVSKELTEYGPANPTLAVEQDLLLVYPFATFFFVDPANTALAEALERGLTRATDDGSFQAYFEGHPDVQAVYDHLNLDARKRFDLENPFLSQATRQIPAKFWLDGTRPAAATSK